MAKSDYEKYDDARAADEQLPTLKRGGYMRRHIAKAVKTVAPAPPTLSVDITQMNTVPPDQVSDDHDSLMGREG